MRKMASCSFRIQGYVKKSLQDLAGKQGRTLSSLIELILLDFLDKQEGRPLLSTSQGDKRHYPRKKVVLPARWRINRGESAVEYDVIVKNISSGGAYTEYINGQSSGLIENLQVSSLRLFVRLPGSQIPFALDCETRHIHITKNAIGVGLHFIRMSNRGDISF
jgi:hypothetical protein